MFLTYFRLLIFVLMITFIASSYSAHSQVIWEDYQGNSRITGTSGQDLPGPFYANGTGTSTDRLNALRTISANAGNAVRTGTSTSINYATSNLTLCNLDSDTAGTGAACQADAQGRVIYAVLRLPNAGNYSFSLAHDDDIDLDFSTAYASTNYRTASYDVPIGEASEYTANDTTYESLAGTVSAPTANSCVLVRLYWNNVGGINHLRLRWTRPNNRGNGTTTEVIPATYYMPPGTTTGCGGSITTTARSLTLNKSVGATGRASDDDQFMVAITNALGTTSLASATTSGAGTGQQASTGAIFVNAGTTYRLIDTMASGSAFTLAAYTPSIACTMNGASATTTSISTGVWSITVPATGVSNQQFICTITNSRASRQLQLRKSWSNAVVGHAVTLPATAGFSSNTAAFNSVANAASETDNGTTITVLTGAGTLKAEAFTNGTASMYRSQLSCTDGTLSGTNGQQDNQLSIGSTGSTIVCTYSNTYIPPLVVSKTSIPYWDPVNFTNSPKLIPGALVDYIITVTSPSDYTVDPNSVVVIDKLPPEVKLFVNNIGGTPAGPAAFTAGTTGLTYNFIALSSTGDDIDFSNNDGASWAYSPTPDGDGIDKNVNSVRIRLKNSMAPSSTFTIRLRARIE